jgi:hypothetical protein
MSGNFLKEYCDIKLNIILEEKLCNKFKNGHENARSNKSQTMIIFEFVGQLFSQNDVFKLQKNFLDHGIRVFRENRF